jgi:hypothetical protein
MMMRKLFALSAAAALLATLSAVGTATAQVDGVENPASVSLVHAAPFAGEASTVTVCIGGEAVFSNFIVGDAIRIDTIAGTFDVDIYVGADRTCEGEPALGETLTLVTGDNLSAIVHFDAEGVLALSVLPNPVECLPAGQGRLVGRHMAVAGPVDATVDGTLVEFGLANGNQVAQDLPAGTYALSIVSAEDPAAVVVPTTEVAITDATVTVLTVYGNNILAPAALFFPTTPTTPVGVITQQFAVDTCPEPTPEPEPEPEPVVARPAFTG